MLGRFAFTAYGFGRRRDPARRSAAGRALRLDAGAEQGHTEVRMRPVLRIYLAMMLSLLLVLTGQSVAESRGIGMAQGQMEICTGTGPVMIYVDAQGQPTKAPHYCPDYALTLLSALAVADITAPYAPSVVAMQAVTGRAQVLTAVVFRALARAPPILI